MDQGNHECCHKKSVSDLFLTIVPVEVRVANHQDPVGDSDPWDNTENEENSHWNSMNIFLPVGHNDECPDNTDSKTNPFVIEDLCWISQDNHYDDT